MSHALRPYQAAITQRVSEAIDGGIRRLLLPLPTGAGKTVVAAEIAAVAVRAGGRVLFLAHRRELITQAARKLHAAGVDHGVIQAAFPSRPGERVQVASIATLHARAIRSSSIDLPEADLVIVDEAHHARAQTYRRLIEAYPGAVILGLTATPCRGDGRGLGSTFEVLVECPPVSELIEAGYLVRATVYAPTTPDLTGVRVERGDYVERQLAERVDTPALVGDIVTHWHRLAERRPTVVFATGVGHSIHLRDEFRRSGVLAEHIDGSTPTEERDAILTRLATGEVEVVSNCSVLTEGWDCPEVACLVLGRPTKSLGLFRQMTGRVLRPAPGKVDALILDHAGAVFAHGFPDDHIEWTLDEDRRAVNRAHAARGTAKAPGLTDCPECRAVRFQGQPCPACGWRPRPRPTAVEVAEGDLGPVDRRTRGVGASYGAAERLAFHRKLVGIEQERNYRPGWAAHQFREKFGSWPPKGPVNPLPADDGVRSWVRHRQIAYAKALARGAAR